jgi:hypothetical protein
LGSNAWITLTREKGALCLSCADLDHLIFLPSGDLALSRRSRKHSSLSAVVLKWSHSRKRYERQGLLVETQALEKAEAECLADSEARTRRQARDAVRRKELDQQFVHQFGQRVRELFPGCPAEQAQEIAEHASLKYSGRVGRSAAAKRFDKEAIHLAVIAHLRHRETEYDRFLSKGFDRREARAVVQPKIERLLQQWERR